MSETVSGLSVYRGPWRRTSGCPAASCSGQSPAKSYRFSRQILFCRSCTCRSGTFSTPTELGHMGEEKKKRSRTRGSNVKAFLPASKHTERTYRSTPHDHELFLERCCMLAVRFVGIESNPCNKHFVFLQFDNMQLGSIWIKTSIFLDEMWLGTQHK